MKEERMALGIKYIIIQYVLIMVAKVAMEWAYINVLSADRLSYPVDVNVSKYIYGVVWLSVLFVCIRHDIRRPSTFFLEFFFVMEMVPITIIYALQNESTVYYTCVCIGMTACELLVQILKNVKFNIWIKYLDRVIIVGCALLIMVFLFITYKNNGFPSLIALNLYDVYKLRLSGLYKVSKYVRYIQALLISVVMPILIAVFIVNKKYLLALFVFAAEFIIYLYEGQKSYLFVGIMVFVITGWSKRKNFEKEFWVSFLTTISAVSFLSDRGIVYRVFMLFIRRVILESASNKFKYFDFFSSHPKEGWAGFFPRWLIPTTSNYGNGYPDGYTYQIGKIYYNAPEMDCNTGFLAEGYLRWGFVGLFFSMIIFAVVLRTIDGMARRTNYELALGCSISVIFSLSDGYLISNLFCGPLTLWFLFLVFYRQTEVLFVRKHKKKLVINSRRNNKNAKE